MHATVVVVVDADGHAECAAQVSGREDFLEGAGGELAAAKERGVRGLFRGDAQVVRDEDDGDAFVSAQAGNGIQQARRRREVEAGGWFVHDEQQRVADERAGD